jgi:hypothetical protein
MRKFGLAIAVVVVLGGAAFFATYYFLSGGPQNDLKRQLDQALQKLPPGWTGAYKGLDVSVASRGAALKGFELHGAGDAKFDLTIDEVDLNGLALAAIPVLYSLNQPQPQPETSPDKSTALADSIVIKGAKFHADDQDLQLASAQVDKPRLYLWALQHPGVPSYGEILKQIHGISPATKPEDLLPILRFEAAMVLGVAEDGYSAADLSGRVKTPPTADAPVTEVTYAVKKLTGAGVDRGKMASVSMEGLTAKAPPGPEIAVDRVAITGLDARDVLTRLLTATAIDPTLADGLSLGKLEYAGMTIKPPGEAPVTLTSVTVANLAFAHGLLVSGDFGVTGLKISKAQVAADEDAVEAFDKLGLQSATVSFGAGYKWDVDKKAATLRQVSVKIDELGSLTLSADLTGIEKADTLMSSATLNHAVLRYDDASFTGRAFKIAAAENGGGDAAAFSKQAIGLVQAQSAMLGANSPGIKAAGAAIVSFLTDPHNLTIELAPPQPMGVAALYAVQDLPPPQIFTQLGVKVTANQK